MILARPSASSRQAEESKIAANWIKRIRECLNESQLSLFITALQNAGISQNDVERGEGLNQSHADRISRELRRSIPELTLLVVPHLELMDLGVIGYAAINSDTVHKALGLMQQYIELTTDRFSEEIEITEQYAATRPIPRINYMEEFRNIAEDSLAGMQRTLEILLGDSVDYSQARALFGFAEPDYGESYRNFFKCPCEFNAETTELRFPVSWLELPVSAADKAMADVCTAMCERILGVGEGTADTPQIVRRLLLSRPGRRILRLEQAAEELRMSTAQLRKRLYRAGTSYKQLVLEVRMELAQHYLIDTNLAIQEIAYLLDYSQPAPFSRAFKDYFKTSPLSFREQHGIGY